MARAGAALVGFACVGMLAAGFLDAAPAAVRVVLALGGSVVAPAVMLRAPLARLLAGRAASRALVAACAAVAVLSLHAVLAQSFALAGTSFSVYASSTTWLVLLFHGTMLVLGWRASRRARDGRSRPVGRWRATAMLAALAGLAAFAALAPPNYTGAEDAYDHMGYVRRTVTMDVLHPNGVLALPDGARGPLPPDPRKGALHDVAAFIVDLSGADAVTVWEWLRVVMFPIAVLAFAAFSRVFLNSGTALVACMILFFLSYSGTAFRLAGAAAYGQSVAAIWYWTVAAAVLSGSPAGRARGALVALATAGGVFVHIGVAAHVAVLAATLLLFAPALGLGRRAAAWAAMWLALGAVFAVAARVAHDGLPPAANEIHTHAQGVMTVGPRWFVMSPMEILRQHGLVFLGGLFLLPVAALAARRDASARASVAVSLLPVCVAFVPPIASLAFERGSYMGFRTLLNAPSLAVAVLGAAWMVRAARARGAAARVAAAGVLAVWAVGFVGPSLRAFASDAALAVEAGTSRFTRPAAAGDRYAELESVVAHLPPVTTVLTDPVTAYRLSAVSSHRFVAILQQHANPCDPDALDRLRAVRDVLSPYVHPHAAIGACRRYGVDVVVVSGVAWAGSFEYLTPGNPLLYPDAIERLRSMPESFREMPGGRNFAVFRFDPAGLPGPVWSGVRPPVVTAAGPAHACDVSVPGFVFDITGFSVEPAAVEPGGRVTIRFGYRRSMASPFGRQVLTHVRFDHESVPASRRFPGEKHLRRARERLGGVTLRFRHDLHPGHGVFEPDVWPTGTELTEQFVVRVPGNAAPGRYRVELRVVTASLLPVFDWSDLLYNRDHYSGVECAKLEVLEADNGP